MIKFFLIALMSLNTWAKPNHEVIPKPIENNGIDKMQQLALDEKEVKSLEESIINDKKSLKTIEDSGSGVEDYKFVKSNLEKRKKRLKELKIIVAKSKIEVAAIKKANETAKTKALSETKNKRKGNLKDSNKSKKIKPAKT